MTEGVFDLSSKTRIDNDTDLDWNGLAETFKNLLNTI
jgi:hypothetical protein